MSRALELAHEAIGVSDPNPRVGCVLVSADGKLLAEGSTREAGGPHAEAVALQTLQREGTSAKRATAYITLEPCSHHGRTPPCVDALVSAGIARAVISVRDPNPLVAGEGLSRLRAAGIEVDLGLLSEESKDLNIGFFSRMERGRPWVRMKIAASLDGRTALLNGRSQWITGEAARTDGHRWRKRAGALLTGAGTVRDDDPRLDVRLVDTVRQPLRVVVDSRLEISPSARILQPPGAVLVYTTAAQVDQAALGALPHVEVCRAAADANGKTQLGALLADLARRGINELHVEAGHRLNGSFVREGLVDEWLVYLAPRLLGMGLEMASFGPLQALAEGVALEFTSVDRIGEDLRVVARRVLDPARSSSRTAGLL